MWKRTCWIALGAMLAAGCGDGDAGTRAVFDLDGPIDTAETFWNLPMPSDLRLAPGGAPDLDGYPNPRDVPIMRDLLTVAPAPAFGFGRSLAMKMNATCGDSWSPASSLT
jgi:hypothetical protein